MGSKRSFTPRSGSAGFTLVELLIVVIILAIIAAIVVPQLSASTDDAKVSALDTDLAQMRTAIDLYYQQHGSYPGTATAVSGADCTATKGTAAAAGADAFAEQLTMFTDTTGKACSAKLAGYTLGPYLKTTTPGKTGIPANPITGVATVVVVTAGDLNLTSTTAPGAGWKYDSAIGKLIADDAAYATH